MYLDGLGLGCHMQDLVLRLGIEPQPSALGMWSQGSPSKTFLIVLIFFIYKHIYMCMKSTIHVNIK